MTPTPQSETPGAPPGDRFRRLGRVAGRYAFRAALAVPALVLLYALALIPFTPGVEDLRRVKSGTPSVVMSADGVVLAEFTRSDRHWVPLDKISSSVVDALIATEDRRFYDHHGIDFRRTAAALLSTLSGEVQGGSTITQQLARNLYRDQIGRSFTLKRKLKEAITAVKIESVYTKREILETYLNTVPFLYNAYGIEMAARTYFNKSADKLSAVEAATLVGMLKATSALNPVKNPERALARRNLVLDQMARNGALSPMQAAELSKRPLGVRFEPQSVAVGAVPHIVRHLQDWLAEWAGKRDRNLFLDGLVVHTTIDSRLQAAANKAVERQMAHLDTLGGATPRPGSRKIRARGEKNKVTGNQATLQAGFMAMDPRNGHVRAWVGSRDFATEEFDHVSQARRQPGSAFKPFVYAAAFTAGMHPRQTMVDAPARIMLEGGGFWEPKDVSGSSYRPMTLSDALVYSKNTITAQVVSYAGPKRVMQLAWALGIRNSKMDPVPSIALGTSPVTLREMVAAYATIASGGYYTEPMIVTRIEDHNGRVLAEFGTQRELIPAIPFERTMELVDALRGAVTRGTGSAIHTRYGITADVAGKTGTTQDYTDGWFIMMHPELVAGARVGYNEKLSMGRWGSGARSALPIVGDVFQQALNKDWIDASAEFGSVRVPPPAPVYTVEYDPFRRVTMARQAVTSLKDQVRSMLQ